MDEMKQFNVTAADILNRRDSEIFNNSWHFKLRVTQYYQQALAYLPAADP